MASVVRSAESKPGKVPVHLIFDKYELELIDFLVVRWLSGHGPDLGLNRIHEAIRDNLKAPQNVL